MQNQPTNQTSNDFFYAVEFDNSQSIVSDDELKKILAILKKRDTINSIESIEKLKTVEGLSMDFRGHYCFDLMVNVKILNQLINSFVDIYQSENFISKETQKKEYIDLLNNISHFIYTGIEQKAKEMRDEIDWSIEHYEHIEKYNAEEK